jgi:hypothetical protein
MQRPSLTDNGGNWRSAVCNNAQSWIVTGLGIPASGHPEGSNGRMMQRISPQKRKQLLFFGIGSWEASLNKSHAKIV